MTELDREDDTGSPLVSVIVRTTGRPELVEALRSIAAQQYRPLEIILVDAVGAGDIGAEQAAGGIPIELVSTGTRLPRPVAANQGLDASRGQFLLFLDEDDWIAPEHIDNLVRALMTHPEVRAVYSSVCKTDARGNLLDDLFGRDFDPELLKRDNYIPIHAMLFERELVGDGCRFDESLDIYEDWDFWLQLSRKTAFLHIDTVTAFYRQGGDSDTDTADNTLRFQGDNPISQARIKLYRKWGAQWSGEEINTLVGKTVMRSELDASRRQLDTSRIQVQELNDYATSLRVILNKTTEENAELGREVDALRKSLQRLKREHAISDLHRDKHLRDLETRLNAIYAMPSWRLMGPFRRVARLLNQALLFPLKKKVHFWRYGTELELPRDEGENGLLDETEISMPKLDEDSKKSFRDAAEVNLRRLLESDTRLALPLTEQPLVSILLVLYNQAPLTLLCIESILKFAPAPYELVIVNNASSDDTDLLLDKLANVTVINNSENAGFVRAVNQGVEHCRGKYLLLLNNDAMLHLYAIESAIQTLESDPQNGAVGGRILLLDGSLQEAGSIIFSDGSCLGYGRHGIPDAPEYMFRRPVDYCSGAFLLFRTALFRELGGFDDDYAPAYYEDSDFCVRLQERGLRVVYDPAAVITHYEFASSGGQHKASQLQDRHRQVLLTKHQEYLARQCAAHASPPLFCRTANRNPNLLVIDDRVPHASLGSGYPRCREILSLLACADLNVSLYPLQFPEESWEATYRTLPRNIEVLLDHGVQQLRAFLKKRHGFYDVILVSRIHNMRALNAVLAEHPDLLEGTSLIYDAEAVTAPRDIRWRELQGENLSEQQKFDLVESEISAARTANVIVAVSAREAALYREHGFNNTVVLGHSLPASPGKNTFEERNGLLFVGALRDEDSPNVDSMHWFIRQVWPLIRAEEPTLTLHVVGDNDAQSLQELAAEGAVFHGRLDDINRLYNQSRVFIAPTRFAAGIPHKVHEAAAHGIPCVVTELLAGQLGWSDRRQLLAGDSPRCFADNCLALYRDPKLWNGLRQAALDAVESECSPEHFRSVLLELVNREISPSRVASRQDNGR